jgi:hypothetical protein
LKRYSPVRYDNLAAFEADLASGYFALPTCNLARVLIEARRLSASHTMTGGHRAFDILHVAASLHLGASEFLTYDTNQHKLATTVGLKSGFLGDTRCHLEKMAILIYH